MASSELSLSVASVGESYFCCRVLIGNTVFEKPKFSYEAKRFPLRISIDINDGHVDWAYFYLGNTWKHRTPLSTLEPYPTFTENQFGMQMATTLFPIALFATIALLTFVGLSKVTIAVGLFTLMIFLLWAAACRIRGPIRWANFDSKYPNKEVFFFQNRDADEFESFAEQLTTLILNARMVVDSNELED